METDREVVVYARTSFCPFQMRANNVFKRYDLQPRTILIDKDEKMADRVKQWTGFLSVPTIIIARPGEDLPIEEPEPLPEGDSPRAVDRGYMITEPGERQLTNWLKRHGIIEG